MTKEEILQRIKEIKDCMFQINMIDKWTEEDFEDMKKYRKELKKLEEKLKEVE